MSQNILEKTIKVAMDIGFKGLTLDMSYDHFVTTLNKDPDTEITNESGKPLGPKLTNKIPTSHDLKDVKLFGLKDNSYERFALLQAFADSEQLNYSFTPDFAKSFKEISNKLDLQKMKCSSLLLAPQIFQISLPNFKYDILIIRSHIEADGSFSLLTSLYGDMRGPNDIVQYQNLASLQSHFESLDCAILEANNHHYVNELGLDNFKYIINCILYISSGKPDIRYIKGHSSKGINFDGKKGKKKFRKYKDIIFSDHIQVGWNFKKESTRQGHWKWQAYGPKWGLHRLRFIESYLTNKRGIK